MVDAVVTKRESSDRTLTFLRVTRMMRGSCCGLTAWNSAWPLRSISCSSTCVAAFSAIGAVSTVTGGPPYGPTASSCSVAPASSAVGMYSSSVAPSIGRKAPWLERCHCSDGVPTKSPLPTSIVPRMPPSTCRLATYSMPPSSSSSSSTTRGACLKTEGCEATGGMWTCCTVGKDAGTAASPIEPVDDTEQRCDPEP